jgi:hypothetical protein
MTQSVEGLLNPRIRERIELVEIGERGERVFLHGNAYANEEAAHAHAERILAERPALLVCRTVRVEERWMIGAPARKAS